MISVLEYVLKQSAHMLKSMLRLIDSLKQLMQKTNKHTKKKANNTDTQTMF